MISDNGRNFVGAARELRQMIRSWKDNMGPMSDIKGFCDRNSISWSFSTPLASHHNGAVESLVKSIKMSLNKVVKERILSEEEYRTVFAEITSCINSRPLWPSCDGNIQQPPITCLDLLRPAGLERNPESMNQSYNLRKRYHYIQLIVDEIRSLQVKLRLRDKTHARYNRVEIKVCRAR